jgi:hypothetical protein
VTVVAYSAVVAPYEKQPYFLREPECRASTSTIGVSRNRLNPGVVVVVGVVGVVAMVVAVAKSAVNFA